MSNAETANEIVRRELEAYYVSPRDDAKPFDIRAAITAALDAKDKEREEMVNLEYQNSCKAWQEGWNKGRESARAESSSPSTPKGADRGE